MPSQSSIAAEEQRRTFRDAMGLFATGVTVITTRHEGVVHGMTANGFMSVSLVPRMIVVSIGEHARMRTLLDQSGVYGVSVLSSDQQHLSAHFAGKPIDGQEVPWIDMEGVPVIAGALTRVAARVDGSRKAGDHHLYLGEVLRVELDRGEPLIFHGGAYRALTSPVEFQSVWRNNTDWF